MIHYFSRCKLFLPTFGLSDFPTYLYLPMPLSHYPIIIIGGGPIGLACGLEAKKAGLDYVILEKGSLVNSLYNYPANMTFFSTSERLEIGAVPFVSNNAKPTRAEALEYYRRVTTSHYLKVNLFEEVLEVSSRVPVTGNEQPETYFSILTNKGVYTANHIIIATGFYDIPYLLNVPGENLPKVTHYYHGHFGAFAPGFERRIYCGVLRTHYDHFLKSIEMRVFVIMSNLWQILSRYIQ